VDVASKLLKLKEWLTIPEAARHLSEIMAEPVGEADLLQMALDGHIKLSVYFPNRAKARMGRLIPYKDVPTTALPSLFGTGTVLYTEGYPLSDKQEAGEFAPDAPFIHFGHEVMTIDGIWDLAMVGNERFDIEYDLQRLINGPEVKMLNIEGTFLNRSDGTWAALQDRFEDQVITNTDGTKKAITGSYYPAGGLGLDCVRVVRVSEVLALQSTIEGSALDKPLSNRERDTLLTIIAVLCKGANCDYTRVAKTAGHIHRTAEDMEISIGETTIETHLKKIPNALGARTK
jgi:hypothetical protein